MKEFGIAEARKIVEENVNDYVYYRLIKMSDEELLKADLRYDFEMDSLDIEEMFNSVHSLYGIAVDRYNPLAEYAFNDDETVENFIDMVNYCMEHDV